MKPEDVNPRHISVEWNDGTTCEHFIPAHEVGAIIRAAMQSVHDYTSAIADKWTPDDERDSAKQAFEAWMAKADELEAMKWTYKTD
jgi:hypothetical protein